ncbi:MAG: hypothetical protein PHE51_10610 [Eubacteriales bacterium]|nr:hypothetical protein [Eubacteriales bacterium]
MYDNNGNNANNANNGNVGGNRICCPESGTVCINIGYLAVVASVVAGIVAYVLYTNGLLANVAAVLFGALAVVVLLGVVVLAIINVFIVRCQKLCCCAKRNAIWYIVFAILTIIAIGLFFAIPAVAAVFFAITVAFFVLAVIFFIAFYQCFLKCRCNTCECGCRGE